jgi:hypothetical protein
MLTEGSTSSTLAMCPSHITHKWAHEVLLTIPAVFAAISASDQLLVHEPAHQLGDSAERHPNPLRQNARRGLIVVEHRPHGNSFQVNYI